ncbi:MAG TPA: DUF4440 domain-containing protein [Steroidobacteraceae bacterium]|jgi:hypothetical protein
MFAVTGLSAHQSSLRDSLQARYAQMKHAMEAHDAQAVTAILAPGFVSLELDGKTESADQMVQDVKTLPSDPARSSQTTLLSIRSTKRDAVVEQRYTMKTRKRSQDGTEHRVELVAVSTDTWILSHGAWLLQRTVTDQLDYYIDGKQVMHQKRADDTAH